MHDNPYGCQESTACSEDILQQIEKLAPQLAILVGYSSFHHRLAGYFKSQSIPVVLYEMTPGTALANLDMNEVGQRVAVALGISPRGSELVQKSGVPYFYIGCPHKDRVDRVIVEAESMGLDPSRPLVSIFPGARIEGVQCTLAVFQQLAESLAQTSDIQVVLSAAEALVLDPSFKVCGRTLAEHSRQPAALRVMTGMNLELLSLSTLAITGPGAITVECGLFEVPLLPIYSADMVKEGMKTLLNQTVGHFVVEEFSSDTPIPHLIESCRQMIGPSPKREKVLKDLHDVKLSLQGFAAENAADYIGREIGQWNQGKRAKGTKTA